MKALLITEYFPPIIHGGGEISAYSLAQALAKNNIEVHVLTSYFPNLKKYEEKDNIKIYRLLETGLNPRKLTDNIKRNILLKRSIKKYATELNKKENFDIIHFLNTTSITNLPEIKAKKIATINNYTNFCPKSDLYYTKTNFSPGEKNFRKYIIEMLNTNYIGKQKLRFYLKYNPAFLTWLYLNYLQRRKQINYVDKLIVLNDLIKRKNTEKIYNIANIETKITFYPIKSENKNPIITFIGTLEKIKGVDLLIKAFSKTKEANLLIVGSGSEENNLKQLCKELNIENKVEFTGKLNQKYLPYIYSKTDIVVLPTRWPEPFARVLLEATFFKKPIIATNTGGNPEAVIENLNGFLINTEQELANKLNILINNKNLREKMAIESGNIYKTKFITEKIIKQIIHLYQK
ncbi:MAG: glycosyltransferase [Candidatus Woesearchaeota archaeon]